MSFLQDLDRSGSPYPLAIFRVAFYGATCVHFAGFASRLEQLLSSQAFRTRAVPALFDVLPRLPRLAIMILLALACAGALAGALGLFPRLSALLTGFGFYLLCSFSVDVQTLALGAVWMTLLFWALGGGGNRALALLGSAKEDERNLTRLVIGYTLVAATFLAGVEKLRSGWLLADDAGHLLVLPEGTVFRPWTVRAASTPVSIHGGLALPLAIMTVAFQLCCPVWFFIRRPGGLGVLVWSTFFAGLGTLFEVPPLFFVTYGLAGLLVAEDAAVTDFVCFLARRRRATWPCV
jgi:hypothetical protein